MNRRRSIDGLVNTTELAITEFILKTLVLTKH